MMTYLCWHLPDGSPERGEEVKASSFDEAAHAFAEMFFHDNEGEWMGGHVMIQELDSDLDGIGDPVRFDADVALADLSITAKRVS